MNFGNFSCRNGVNQRSYICREKCFAFASVRILELLLLLWEVNLEQDTYNSESKTYVFI